MSETALALLEKPTEETPSALMRRATDVAGVCKEIVMRTAMELQGKKYVKVEGWMSIAAAYGCVPSIREVCEEPQGIRAVAELKRHDGVVLATAEGFVGLDEPRWANQPLYARRGMAQTRAISRVCRSVFAFCVVLIDENLQTTPAEEIPHGVSASDVVDVVAKPVTARAVGVRDASTKIPYGKSKGKHLCDASDEDISWLLGAAKKSVDANDPKWHAKNVKWLEAVQAEAARRITDSGRVVAPAPVSERRTPKRAEFAPADEDEGEEIVTPQMAFFRLAQEFRVSPAQLASRAQGALGKQSGFTHADIAILRTSLEAVPNR
jgi:hypothetical protein